MLMGEASSEMTQNTQCCQLSSLRTHAKKEKCASRPKQDTCSSSAFGVNKLFELAWFLFGQKYKTEFGLFSLLGGGRTFYGVIFFAQSHKKRIFVALGIFFANFLI